MTTENNRDTHNDKNTPEDKDTDIDTDKVLQEPTTFQKVGGSSKDTWTMDMVDMDMDIFHFPCLTIVHSETGPRI